jgi:hypothetical protein
MALWAARRVREFLTELTASRRLPKNASSTLRQEPLIGTEMDAWVAIQETRPDSVHPVSR